MTKDKENKTITLQEALSQLRNICIRSEKCVYDIRSKLIKWNINNLNSNEIIESLLNDKYIDEERYAKAFVHDKSHLSNWGQLKIKTALKVKNISCEIINKVINEYDTSLYIDKLKNMLEKKTNSLKTKNIADLKLKLIRFAMSRGFEYEMAYNIVVEIIKNKNPDF